jgi:hypothetical protein
MAWDLLKSVVLTGEVAASVILSALSRGQGAVTGLLPGAVAAILLAITASIEDADSHGVG